MSATKAVAGALGRDQNNFDLVRLIAALLVIYGHSFSVVPESGGQDFLFSLSGYATAGMAVKIFFFLSGLLVVNSLLEKRSISDYILARFFRIFPALALVLIVSALVIGPLATDMPIGHYFGNPNTYLYIKRQLLMQSWGTQGLGYYNLPGVFSNNAYKSTVNASLWSLVVEVYAYLFIAAVYLVGLFEKRIATFFVVLVIFDSLLPSRIIFTFLPLGNEDFSFLPFCFACGVLLALHKEQIQISGELGIGFLLLFLLMHGTVFERFLFYLSAFATVVYFATNRIMLKFRPKVDVSYGVFLWGFPVQQSLVHWFPYLGRLENCLFSMFIATFMGFLSWFLVERRAISLGKYLAIRVRTL